MININIKNIGLNTEYCFDSNGSQEFKCECNEGFDGPRCEDECSLECEEKEICTSRINLNGIKTFVCACNLNPCCGSGPTPLCCQNGVCGNENFVYNATLNNADECQCLCTDNFTGSFKYKYYYYMDILIINNYIIWLLISLP